MKISDTTKEILKNFSEINPNLMITPGKEIKTISTISWYTQKLCFNQNFFWELFYQLKLYVPAAALPLVLSREPSGGRPLPRIVL